MPQAGAVLRATYVAVARFTRTCAVRTGLLRRLDRTYRRRPTSVRGHLRTLFAIHDVQDMVGLDTPWWTYGATRAVEAHLAALGGRARVFEYGSGASTVWLGHRSAEVHSVEHHEGFAAVMRDVLERGALGATVHLHVVPPEHTEEPVTRSGRRGEDTVDYTRYARTIEEVGGEFDLIVVDGRARVACLEHAQHHLAPGGLIVFDDAQRPRYRDGLRGSGRSVRRMWGWVPSLPYPRQTALLS